MAERGRFAPYADADADADVEAMKISIHGDAAAAVLRAIVVGGVAQVRAHEAAVAASADPEQLHQLRVELRRLRSALVLFKQFAQAPVRLRDDLRWSARQLGLARDAEVLAWETLARVPVPAIRATEWAFLRETAAAAATLARRRAVDILGQARYLRWQPALLGWVRSLADEAGSPAVDASPGVAATPARRPLGEMRRSQLRRLRRRLIDCGRDLPGADAAARHRARIAAKKLRYATEILEPGHRSQSALGSLQQELGLLNDAEVAVDLLDRLAAATPALAWAAGYAQGWLAAEARQRARRLGRCWKEVRGDL